MMQNEVKGNRGSKKISRRRLLQGGAGLAALGIGGTAYWLGRTDVTWAEGRSRARAIVGDIALPETVDVVVIGGGFVGTCAALTLAERGARVALCEKGVVAGEASGRSMGFIYSPLATPDDWPLLARSKELWSELNSRTQVDTGYRPNGLLVPIQGDAERAYNESWIKSVRGMPSADGRIVSGTELAQLTGAMTVPPAAALYVPSDGSVEPQLAAPAIAEGARRHGATILQNCAVRGLDLQAGKVAGVITEKGRIACQAVVLAGGAWSPLFLRSLGLSFEQFDAHMSMAAVSGVTAGPSVSISGKFGLRRQVDGNYSVGAPEFVLPLDPPKLRSGLRLLPQLAGMWPRAHIGLSPSQFWHQLRTPSKWPLDAPSPFEEHRVLMPHARTEALDSAVREVRKQIPAFREAVIRERWAGVISFANPAPAISSIDSIPGLHIGSGFSEGLTMGPATGEALADLAMGRKPRIDLHHYRFDRKDTSA